MSTSSSSFPNFLLTDYQTVGEEWFQTLEKQITHPCDLTEEHLHQVCRA